LLDAANALSQLRAPLVALSEPRGIVAGGSAVSLAVAVAGGRAPYAIDWRQTSGAPLALQGADGAELRFVAPPTRQSASFEVDGLLDSAPASFRVDVRPEASSLSPREDAASGGGASDPFALAALALALLSPWRLASAG